MRRRRTLSVPAGTGVFETCVFLNCGVSVHGILELFQCHGSTGHCWCVDSRGQERPGTRTPPGVTRVDCDRRPGEAVDCDGLNQDFL